MKTKIFLLNIAERLESPIDEFLRFFSAERQEKISRYRFNADKNRTVFAEILARKLIAERTGKKFTEIEVLRDSKGKPYCEEPGIFFSLSHSGEWIACSVGDSENGIDVEILNRKIDINIAKRFFLPGELEILKSLDESERRRKFFEYWTLKEACLKCLGLRDWRDVDCEKLLSGDYENLRGKNFFIEDAVVGVCEML